MADSELKDCPFCGCAAGYVKHSAGVPGTQGFDKWDAVACKHCRATVGACDRRFRCRDDARDAWNRRAATKAAAPADAPTRDIRDDRGEVVGIARPSCKPQGRAPAEDAREEVPRAEQVLRRLLAYRVSGALLYTDGGELQDASTHPWIDFKRDSVDSIEANLIERARRAASAPAVPGTKVVPITPTLEMVKAGDATMNGRGTCVLAWRAMVDAAPAVPGTGREKTCTCPSGDGSLRWPCPVHPLEAKAGEDA